MIVLILPTFYGAFGIARIIFSLSKYIQFCYELFCRPLAFGRNTCTCITIQEMVRFLVLPHLGFWPMLILLRMTKGKAILDSHPKVEGPARAPKRSSRGRVMSPSNGCHWQPSDIGTLKLNVGATWNVDSAGIEDLIRNHQGQVWISFARRLEHLPSPEYAETIAIREGLCLAERFGYANFTIESDCKEIIDQLKSHCGALSSLGHVHINRFSFQSIGLMLFYILLYVVPILAHFLIGKAISTYRFNVWMELVPYFISTAIQANLI